MAGKRSKKWKLFEETREYVRGLGLKSAGERAEYYKPGKKREDIPTAPHRTYKDDGWTSWTD